MSKNSDGSNWDVKAAACKLGRVAFGDDDVSVHISIAKKALKPASAEKLLCQTRNEVRIVMGDPEQGTIGDIADDITVEGVVDVPSFSSNRAGWGCTLQFHADELGLEGEQRLRALSQKDCAISLERVGDAPEKRGRPSREAEED